MILNKKAPLLQKHEERSFYIKMKLGDVAIQSKWLATKLTGFE